MSTPATWFSSTESWLDERGKGAWLAAMILGFIFFWPVGLAILFYMIWSNRMSGSFFCSRSSKSAARRVSNTQSSGNAAFDAYRDDTLKRLEDEQTAFQSFLQRLRDAKDKTEFDQFMNERARDVAAPSSPEPKTV
ncbi:DUF2852 domain-containing protein [Neptunicoccus cionae]|uniref:DUF2852 domain-containing protein n=1 Tax=Neptunicoccus cionae TaxID=2035344 RepID=A0A916QU89_9RHOB|nr:DUF2852 domain-containing protein [Amylibacter cionae]GGA09023.1 hypothetical protein GCM10011498_06220 [Amylibacter cionae]